MRHENIIVCKGKYLLDWAGVRGREFIQIQPFNPFSMSQLKKIRCRVRSLLFSCTLGHYDMKGVQEFIKHNFFLVEDQLCSGLNFLALNSGAI